MAYRACDEASESHMFRRPDDEKRRIPGLSDQNGSGVAACELDQPIRAWVYLVEYRRNAGAVTRINVVECGCMTAQAKPIKPYPQAHAGGIRLHLQMITLGRAQTSTRDDHDLAGSVQPSRRAYPQTLYHVGVVLGELGVAPRQPA